MPIDSRKNHVNPPWTIINANFTRPPAIWPVQFYVPQSIKTIVSLSPSFHRQTKLPKNYWKQLVHIRGKNPIKKLLIGCSGRDSLVYPRPLFSTVLPTIVTHILKPNSYLQVHENDRLSPMICHACISYLNSWQSFKNRSDAAQKKQKSWINEPVTPGASLLKQSITPTSNQSISALKPAMESAQQGYIQKQAELQKQKLIQLAKHQQLQNLKMQHLKQQQQRLQPKNEEFDTVCGFMYLRYLRDFLKFSVVDCLTNWKLFLLFERYSLNINIFVCRDQPQIS